MKLIEIKKDTFNVTLDLKYSSDDNILGKKIFYENRCFLLHLSRLQNIHIAFALHPHSIHSPPKSTVPYKS